MLLGSSPVLTLYGDAYDPNCWVYRGPSDDQCFINTRCWLCYHSANKFVDLKRAKKIVIHVYKTPGPNRVKIQIDNNSDIDMAVRVERRKQELFDAFYGLIEDCNPTSRTVHCEAEIIEERSA